MHELRIKTNTFVKKSKKMKKFSKKLKNFDKCIDILKKI